MPIQEADLATKTLMPINKSKVAINKNSIEGMTAETDKKVTGQFINIECPGQDAAISCRYYKGQQLFTQAMKDGENYTIPLSVARHINERCHYEPHHYLMDEKGQQVKSPKRTPRYKFMIGG